MAEPPSPPLPRFAGEGADSGKRTDFARLAPYPVGEGSAREALWPATWVLSDACAGHEIQSLGIAEALGLDPELKRIRPRALFAVLAPFGPIDPREAGRLAPPFPDLLIASGRRTVPYLRHVKRASGGRTFTIYVNAPATGLKTADVIVAPRHDGLQGANVIAPLTPANRLTATLLARTRADPDPRVAALPSPRVALLIGGDSRRHRFSDRDIAELAALAQSLLDEGASVMATVSRRTPPRLVLALRDVLDAPQNSESLRPFSPWERGARTFLWEGNGPNPYLSLLSCAEAIVVTADSVNMVSEAASTGAPVHVFEPSGGHPKITAFLEGLEAYGAVRRWGGRLEHWSYEPLNSTPAIAEAIAKAFGDFGAELSAARA